MCTLLAVLHPAWTKYNQDDRKNKACSTLALTRGVLGASVGQWPPFSGVLHHVAGPAPLTHSEVPAVSGFVTASVGLKAFKSAGDFRAGYVVLSSCSFRESLSAHCCVNMATSLTSRQHLTSRLGKLGNPGSATAKRAAHMMEAMVSAACTVAVMPQLPESPPASFVTAGEPTGSEDSAIVTAMAVLPRPVTASAAVRGTAAPTARATTSRRRVWPVCGAIASCEPLYVDRRRSQQHDAIAWTELMLMQACCLETR